MTDAVAFKAPTTIWEADYIVLDQKKVPQNTIESIESKMIKINRRLKKEFKTQSKFDKKIKEEITSDKNGNVSVDQLRDFVLHIIE